MSGTLVSGGGDQVLTGVNSLSDAGAGDLSFFGNERYLPQFRKTRASAVLIPRRLPAEDVSCALIEVENPSFAFAEVMKRFAIPAKPFTPGIHPAAVVDESAVFDRNAVSIGAQSVVAAGACIGEGTEIGAGCFIGEGVRIGKNCLLHPNVTILRHCVVGNRVILNAGVVIGSDGFGFENVQGRHVKIDQVGIVQIDDDVEIGANTAVDRARFGRTHIGEGTKIDNLVQIAHNVVIGRHCIVAGQAGIAGSTRIADNVVVAAQAGIAGHLELASGVIIAAQAGVNKSLTKPGSYLGYHAQPMRESLKILALQRQLPEMLERIRILEERLAAAEATPRQA